MHWIGAKNILILLFVCINVFLFGILMSTLYEGKLTQETLINTRKVLMARNIDLRCELPGELIKMTNLKAVRALERKQQSFSIPKQEIIETSMESHVLSLLEEENALAFMPLQRFQLYASIAREQYTELLFAEETEGAMIFYNSVRANVYADRITGEASYLLLEAADEKRSIMPVNQVLLKYYIASQERLAITDLQLGYVPKPGFQDGKEHLFIPVWRIAMHDGSFRVFKAFTGEEVSGVL